MYTSRYICTLGFPRKVELHVQTFSQFVSDFPRDFPVLGVRQSAPIFPTLLRNKPKSQFRTQCMEIENSQFFYTCFTSHRKSLMGGHQILPFSQHIFITNPIHTFEQNLWKLKITIFFTSFTPHRKVLKISFLCLTSFLTVSFFPFIFPNSPLCYLYISLSLFLYHSNHPYGKFDHLRISNKSRRK